ncbi:TRAP transporter small permease [Polymorphospora rubra]|uniref:TRAP transporter small permease n=1 Tax=Polymorphospora rubra TaxID=338584 RepID=UPI0033DF3B9F
MSDPSADATPTAGDAPGSGGGPPAWHRISGWIDRTERFLGATFLALVLLLVLVQVLQRITVGSGWAWTGEIAKYGMVWSTFILAGHLLRRGLHLRLEVIDRWLGPRSERLVTRLTDALVALICIGLTWAGYGLVTAPFVGAAPASGLSLRIVYLISVVGLGLTALAATGQALFGRPGDDRRAKSGPAVEGAI